MGRNFAHVVEVPFTDYVLRITETIFALALIVLSTYTLIFYNYTAVRLALFTVSGACKL